MVSNISVRNFVTSKNTLWNTEYTEFGVQNKVYIMYQNVF